MFVCVRIYVCVRMCVCVGANVLTKGNIPKVHKDSRLQPHVHIPISFVSTLNVSHRCVYVYVCMYVYICVCVYVCVCVCVLMCVCVYVCVCMCVAGTQGAVSLLPMKPSSRAQVNDKKYVCACVCVRVYSV